MSSTASLVRQKYRCLGRLVNRLPETTKKGSLGPEDGWKQLRQSFREPLKDGESLDSRLQQADDKASFLRMITPSTANTNKNCNSSSKAGRWVYKDGKQIPLEGNAPVRDKNGRVISNWDGKNLDPCSVKQHNYQLKRMGFRDNAHAKGIF